jgi:hypothetical protein
METFTMSRKELPVQTFLRDRYAGFNDTHVTEKLREGDDIFTSQDPRFLLTGDNPRSCATFWGGVA